MENNQQNISSFGMLNTNNTIADDIAIDLDAIQANEAIESNAVQVNQIYLQTLAKGIYEFNSQQVATLDNIRNQCPLAGGNSVFRARALYHLIRQDAVYNDFDICNAEGYSLREPEKEVKPNVTLYPNPANESVTVVYKAVVNCKLTLVLADVTGRIVVKHSLPAGTSTFEFSTRNFLPALYSYRVTCNDSAIENGKLVIIH